MGTELNKVAAEKVTLFIAGKGTGNQVWFFCMG